jgi:selenocysteine lyase/cysteine desulfurase
MAIAVSALGKGDEVVISTDEFASVLMPVLAAAQQRGATVRRVDFADLADELRSTTTLVATSHVRSSDGRVQDLGRLAGAAHAHGAALLVDATHSAGILPIDADHLGIDFLVAAAYKHLLCPRGVAFLHIRPERLDRTVALTASWRGMRAPYGQFYGGELPGLADTARRHDVSLAWHPWVGAEAGLRFLCEVAQADRRDWPLRLAAHVANELGVPVTGSSIVTVPIRDRQRVRDAATRANARFSVRATDVRLSFHLYNDQDDAQVAIDVLTPYVDRSGGDHSLSGR